MTQKPRHDNKDGRADSPLHKAWASLTTTLGMPLTVALAVGVGMIIVLLAVGLIWYLMPIFGFKNGLTITERKDLVQGLASVVQALAVVLTGTVGLIGLLFTWRNLRQTRESTQRTLELTEQGQITERFTRAIDQLGATDDDGNPRLEVRLGGIYALERIDKESPERAYHSTVMEVLTAYVRENAPWPPKSSNKSPEREFIKPPEGDSVSNSSPNVAAEQDEGAEQEVEPTSGTPRTDIQAVLDVLKRREEDRVPKKPRVRLDLRGTDLQGADLRKAYLYDANLGEGNLQKATLLGANLFDADVEGANLLLATLLGANFQRASLQGARLGEGNLQKATLAEANLRFANLKGADLQGANLRYADLQGARGLTEEQIEWTIGSLETKLPEGLNRPQLWSKDLEAQRKIVKERLRGLVF
jgi:hypothetical protein